MLDIPNNALTKTITDSINNAQLDCDVRLTKLHDFIADLQTFLL